MEIVSFKTDIVCGKPSLSDGKICSREVIEGAISRYKKNDYRVGMLCASTPELDISKVSHRINGLYVDVDDTLCAIIELLDTECGKLVETHLTSLNVVLSATCTVDEGNNVTLLNFIRFDLDIKG